MFMLGLMVPSFAETVTIGTGDQTARYPMDFFWKTSLYQTLYYPDELGFTSGTITALEFYNNFPEGLTGKPTKIWLGTTSQSDLSTGYIPANQLTLVFDGNVDYPAGENAISITLQTSYTHTPGNLVLLVQRPMDDAYFSSSSYFKCQTIGTDRARYHRADSGEVDPNSPPGGTATGQFPMIKITYTPVTIVNDLGAISISGNTTPTAGTSYNYTIGVKNNGTATQSTYQVKLMSGTTELASVAGPTLASLETAEVIIPWTPTTAGAMSIYGKVVLAGDEFPVNDETAPLDLSVQPTGTSAVTIGTGDQLARIPMDFYYKNSLYQCLYYPDELGIMSGTISSIAFYNDFVTNNPPGATKVWLGSTTALDLSGGWIPSTQMTLVFDGNVDYPSGQNTITIPLQTPFEYTSGNLVMMVLRPTDTSWHSSSDYFKCQTVGNSRALNYYSDSTPNDPASPTGGSLTGQFPQTTFFYTGQAIQHDLGVLSLTGNTTPSVGTAENYIATVKNNGASTENNYQVKLMMGDVELASVNGPAIQSQQTLEISLPWTPATTGTVSLVAQVIMAGDQIDTNNQSLPLSVSVQAAGVVTVTVGDGGSTDRYPFDFYWKNSLFETIYQASEMNIGGVISGIQFYNSFTQDVGSKPVKVWLAETPQTDLSGGFIPATEMDLVFDGNIVFPNGSNDIFIPVDPPWVYGGGNIVMMTNRCMDTQYYASTNHFVTQSGPVANRSRYLRADSTEYDPNNPAAGTAVDAFPKTTFFVVTEGMGALNGTVYGPGNTPIEGATVSVANSSLVYTTGADGTYSFPYIYEGAQTVSATKHGYTVDTHTVTIVEDQTTTQNFNIALLPQVTVTGRIVGSDQPTVGLADATITLSGYEPYSATTNAQGQFTINNVFASQTYQYVANATGYQVATGEAVVGTTDLNMGDIIVNEVAFPPYGVQAVENDAATQVAVTWEAPDPNAIDITEGFENDTFPPTDWTQTITNTTDTGAMGVGPTWTRMGTVALTPPVPPTEGDWQAGLWWGYDYQDEWLITPQFNCPPNGALTFDSYVYYGSTHDDHYYVKVSTDGGNTWTVLWDATALTGEWNNYTAPITVPLTAYTGQQIKLAFNAQSAPGDGLWYVWFIDNVHIGNPDMTLKFNSSDLVVQSNSANNSFALYNTGATLPTSKAKMLNPDLVEGRLNVPETKNDRVMTGYKVWRLLQGQEENESEWTSLTPSIITNTNYTDTAWQPLPSGVYKFAVKAAYTNDVYSMPAFSNEIHKGMMGTLTGTVTDFGTNQPVEGAVITAGEYSGTSNAQGVFSFRVYAGTYDVTCFKAEYQLATQPGVVIVGTQTTTQNFVLTEIAFPPYGVQAVENDTFTQVNVTWEAPDPNAIEITEGFEDATFPPTDWTQVITNTTDTGALGVGPTWCRFGTVELSPAVPPASGEWQAGLWWGYDYQDEWLITPQFVCPPNGALTFDSYVYYGSTHDDHYYVKISTDDGATWTVLWDATAITTGAWNNYTDPITVPLSAYSGQQIKLAFNAQSAPGDGLWYVWFIDNVHIGNPDMTLKFNSSDFTVKSLSKEQSNRNLAMYNTGITLPASKAQMLNPDLVEEHVSVPETKNDRVIIGYRVWRLLQGQEANESAWTSLTTSNITPTNYTDTAWQPLPSGVYKYAVKAVYTNNVYSDPAFSNEIHKGMMGVLTGTVTEFGTNLPIEDATIVAGDYSGTTNAQGVYSVSVYAGTYNVICSKPNYQPSSQAGVVIVGMQTTTQDFVLTELTNPPVGVVAEEVSPNVNITWMEPGSGGVGFEESFENDTFPPTDWTQVVTNTTDTGALGVGPTWTRMGTVELTPAVPPSDGQWQTGLWWGYNYQDEWLITPEFNCPYDGQMVFDTYVFEGSTYSDHYYVKVSTDGGNTWTELWDASTLTTGDWNRYQTPITVSLSDYSGQAIKLAFNAQSAPGDGLWYVWFVDNVRVESASKTIAFNMSDFATRSGVQRSDAGMTRAIPTRSDEGNRALEGYRVWRLQQGQETNESSWVSLTDNPISATGFQDTGWANVADGTYKWAVKAIYTGGAASPAALSNPLPKITQIGTIVGIVLNTENATIPGATVTCAGYTATTNNNGAYSMQVIAGTHSVTASHPDYASVTQHNVVVTTGQTTTLNFTLPPMVTLFEDGFEAHDDFSINFAPWTLVDVDQMATWGISTGPDQQVQFPNTEQPQAFIIFNPTTCVPALDLPAHGGVKFAACIAANPGPNDDWMITPQINGVSEISFWAAAISSGYTERFKVGVSTTGTNPADFTYVSGDAPVVPTTTWTKYTYDLAQYSNTPIYIGIHCISNDAFMLMIDDVAVRGSDSIDDPTVPALSTALNSNYPNPFNPETTISYSLSQGENVKIEVYNVRGQLVRTLVNENKAAGHHKVVWTGVDNNNRPVSSGVYYYKMTAGKYSSSKKMILMK
jgi:hypothetical protein